MEGPLIDSSLLKKLEALKLNSNVVLNRGYSGGRKSRSKGSSVEFSDFREYTSGDDFRKIDWNAYGRFERLFVKLFMEEREALINFFIDTSKSMDFGSPRKSYVASQLSLALGYLSLSNLDRVNFFSQNDGTLKDTGYLNGKNSIHRAAAYLETLKFDEKNDFFSSIKSRPYKRGISIILSDLFTDNLEDTIKYLAYMNQSIIVLHLLSSEELKPQVIGDLRFIDSETEESKDISITSTILASYDKTLKTFIFNIKEICRKYGAMYVLLPNETSIEEMIFSGLIKAGILR